MSTNKTPNYNLHSWVAGDEFHVSEINENFALLDAALKAEDGRCAKLETALGERIRMVTGSYTGNGRENESPKPEIRVELGVRPRAVVIMNTARGVSGLDLACLGIAEGSQSPAVTFDAQGFIVRNEKIFPNYVGTVYHYAAFY